MWLGELFGPSSALAGRGSSLCICNVWGVSKMTEQSPHLWKLSLQRQAVAAPVAEILSHSSEDDGCYELRVLPARGERAVLEELSRGRWEQHTPVCSCA